MKWITISERLPTIHEREVNTILWWSHEHEQAWCGRYESYDGKRICVGTRHEWSIGIPLYEFSHWAILTDPNIQGDSNYEPKGPKT